MTIENVYSHLEYLAGSIEELAVAVDAREQEYAHYQKQISELTLALEQAQSTPAPVQAEDKSEELRAQYEAYIAELNEAIQKAQQHADKADARAALAEAENDKAQTKIQGLTLELKAAKQKARKAKSVQMDMFAEPEPVDVAPTAPTEKIDPTKEVIKEENKSSVQKSTFATRSSHVANDANALILAKKLDSTIDRVQRLIREARA